MRSFYSDNGSGIHPKVLAAIERANTGHAAPYGDDAYTQAVIGRFRKEFGQAVEVFFTFNGTAANVAGIAGVLQPFEAVLCGTTSHIHLSEGGALERFVGCRVLLVPTTVDGKLDPRTLEDFLPAQDPPHVSPVRVVSITQPTELGTVYTVEEITELAEFAHAHELLLHLDGARLPNAAVSLGVGLGDITTRVGVDIASFGGTKNGLMLGEAVLFRNRQLATHFAVVHKQMLQLASKMRFLSVQFDALLADALWMDIAGHENAMARLLAQQAEALPGVELTRTVQANAVFARLPSERVEAIQEIHHFPIWDVATSEVRWMTSFDTTEADVSAFVSSMKRLLGDCTVVPP